MRLAHDETGAAAVEFSLVLPVLILFLVGGFFVAGMLFAGQSLQFAVQAAARCASITNAVCSSDAATQNYAASRYMAQSAAGATFVSTNAACGHRVTGTVTYVVDLGARKTNVPITATACYP